MKTFIRQSSVLILVVFLGACSTLDIFKTVEEKGGDLADRAYATLAIFNEVDAVALKYAQTPGTPQEIINLLTKLREPARASVPLIAEAAKAYRAVNNRLRKQDNPDTLAELSTAVIVLSERINTYGPPIQRFIDYVNKL